MTLIHERDYKQRKVSFPSYHYHRIKFKFWIRESKIYENVMIMKRAELRCTKPAEWKAVTIVKCSGPFFLQGFKCTPHHIVYLFLNTFTTLQFHQSFVNFAFAFNKRRFLYEIVTLILAWFTQTHIILIDFTFDWAVSISQFLFTILHHIKLPYRFARNGIIHFII